MQLVEKLITIAEECQNIQLKKLKDICEKWDAFIQEALNNRRVLLTPIMFPKLKREKRS